MPRYSDETVERLVADAHAFDREGAAPVTAIEFVQWLLEAEAAGGVGIASQLPSRWPAHRPKGSRDRDPDAKRRRSEGQRRRQAALRAGQ